MRLNNPSDHVADDADACPFVSIVMPVYLSEITLAASVSSVLAQTYPSFELIVVDSGPTDACCTIMRTSFTSDSRVRYIKSDSRLLPHAARNLGIALADGELVVSIDPDIYAPSEWLSLMVQAYRMLPGVIVGGIRCYGHRWTDVGVHFAKFDKWLPGQQTDKIDIGATANVLYPKAALSQVGFFDGSSMIDDTRVSWALAGRGIPLYFIPSAWVEHHHFTTVAGLMQERYKRGQDFARLRVDYWRWTRLNIVVILLATLFPLRLASLCLRTARHGWAAGLQGDFILCFPLIVLGHLAWLTGEARVYLALLLPKAD